MNFFRAVYKFFYEILLGCSHDRLTRPFTLHERTYKVCLDCGSQIFYSSATMRPLSAREVRRINAVQASDVDVKVMPGKPVLVPASRRKSNAA